MNVVPRDKRNNAKPQSKFKNQLVRKDSSLGTIIFVVLFSHEFIIF